MFHASLLVLLGTRKEELIGADPHTRDLLVKRPRNPKQEQLHLGFTVNKITCNMVYRTEESKGVSDMQEWRFQNAREQRSVRSCENIN